MEKKQRKKVMNMNVTANFIAKVSMRVISMSQMLNWVLKKIYYVECSKTRFITNEKEYIKKDSGVKKIIMI